MDKGKYSYPLDIKKINITDEFWGREQELVRKEVIPYQWEALNDRVEGADPSFCMRNFKVAGRLMKQKREKKDFVMPAYSFRGFNALPEEGKEPEDDKFYGFVFQDSDFSKWIEAVGYSLSIHPDEQLEKTADEAIDIVVAAQAPNGYLDTYYIINGMDRIFTHLQDHHELYCFGHLLEGAISYYQATGKDKLLNAAKRYADYVFENFGYGENQIKGYPGHEIAEMALARLHELSGEEKYLKLAKFFIDERGKQPYIFDEQAKERAAHDGGKYIQNTDPNRYAYYQAAKPVREQDEAVGHAVRAVYLYSGMADVARLTGDEALYQVCEKIWNNIVSKKLYITGGIGSSHIGESFTQEYDLPNDTAYSETCAAIGLAFFARRMLQIEPKAIYGDVMEQALYNTVLAGMALDGKSFFYVNPLEVNPFDCKNDPRKFHVKPVRQKWFGCACCPPNIARIVSSLGAYAYTANEDALFVHLYTSASLNVKVGGQELKLDIESGFPWNGDVNVKVQPLDANADSKMQTMDSCVNGRTQTLAFRIPGWAGEYEVELTENAADGAHGDLATRSESFTRHLENGYLYISGVFTNETEIKLHFPMEIKAKVSSTKVRENVGKIAFTCGPITYCVEEADNGADLPLLRVDANALSTATKVKDDSFGHEVYKLVVKGYRQEKSEASLYLDYGSIKEMPVDIVMIPYYTWANRGEGEMQVWTKI